jgi:hypothetical protein
MLQDQSAKLRHPNDHGATDLRVSTCPGSLRGATANSAAGSRRGPGNTSAAAPGPDYLSGITASFRCRCRTRAVTNQDAALLFQRDIA